MSRFASLLKRPNWVFDFGSFALDGIKAFPLTVISGFCWSIAAIILVDVRNLHNYDLFNYAICVALGISLFFGVEVSEKINGRQLIYDLLKILFFVGLIGLFYTLPDHRIHKMAGIRLTVLFLASHLLVSFIPFIRSDDEPRFWRYNLHLFTNFFSSLFLGILLIIGILASVKSIEFLFKVDINWRIMWQIAWFILGTFSTLLFCWQFSLRELREDPMGLKIRIKKVSTIVFLPLLSLYFVILHAYIVKIAFTQTLPQGWISKLVLGYSGIGIFTYLITYNNVDRIRFFRKRFFWILFLPIGFLFLSIYRRISDYGVTEMRYFVALIAIWLLCVTLYFTLFKNKARLKWIPISLFICCIFSIIGPWNAFQASWSSQADRVKQALVDLQYPDLPDMTLPENLELQADISSSLNFLYHYKDTAGIKDLMAPSNPEIDGTESVQNALKKLGLIYNTNRKNQAPRDHISYNIQYPPGPLQIDSHFFMIRNINRKDPIKLNGDAVHIQAHPHKDQFIEINGIQKSLDLDGYMIDLHNKHGNTYRQSLTREELLYQDTVQHWAIRIYFNHLYINTQNDQVKPNWSVEQIIFEDLRSR